MTTLFLSYVGDAIIKTVEETANGSVSKWLTTTIERNDRETVFADGASRTIAEMKHDQAIELVMHILCITSTPIFFDHNASVPLFDIFDFDRDGDVALGEELLERLIQTLYRYNPTKAAEYEADLKALVEGTPHDFQGWGKSAEEQAELAEAFQQYSTTCDRMETDLVTAINAALPLGIRYILRPVTQHFVFEVPNVVPIRLLALQLITAKAEPTNAN